MTFTLLLPPSRGMAAGGHDPGWSPDQGTFGQSLGSARAEIAAALVVVDGGDGDLLGLKGDRLEAAAAANRELVGAPTLPAAERYTGVVFNALDPTTLSDRSSLVVVSALLGLAAMNDPVPPYRLAGNDTLPDVGRLRDFWPEALSSAYRMLERPVYDLTSREYRRLLPDDADRISVEVVKPDGKGAGHWGKVAKGVLVRRMVESGDPGAVIASFEHEGLRAVIEG